MAVDPDQIFKGLSEDPDLASYELLLRIETGLGLKASSPAESAYAEACGLLEAFYEAKNWKIPNPLSTGGFGLGAGFGGAPETVEQVTTKSRAQHKLQFEAYVAEIMGNYRSVMKQKAKAALDGEIAQAPGYAVLDGDEKKEIHDHIAKIRSIIEGSSLDDRKKNSLLGRLNDLAREVDRNGTRTDRFLARRRAVGRRRQPTDAPDVARPTKCSSAVLIWCSMDSEKPSNTSPRSNWPLASAAVQPETPVTYPCDFSRTGPMMWVKNNYTKFLRFCTVKTGVEARALVGLLQSLASLLSN